MLFDCQNRGKIKESAWKEIVYIFGKKWKFHFFLHFSHSYFSPALVPDAFG